MKSIKEIINLVEQDGFATDNLVFGSGGMLIVFIFNEKFFFFEFLFKVVFYKNLIVIQ
jgi:hypothetical protein